MKLKKILGRRLRSARDLKGLSRQVLSARLGVSPKTVQSWEMGRTFIEKLSLFPLIERELGISLSEIIEEAMLKKSGKTSKKASESKAKYGKTIANTDAIETNPVVFSFNQVKTNSELNTECSKDYYAIPVIKPSSISKPVFDLKDSDVIDHTIISKDWIPRGGVMIACNNADNGMEPTIPADSLIIIDRRELILEKSIGRNIAIFQKGKGS